MEEKTNEMTDKEMDSYLQQFSRTIYFKAVERYLKISILSADNSWSSIDLDKEPHRLSRVQGIKDGLSNLLIYIKNIKENE